jgi:hypothetical protein
MADRERTFLGPVLFRCLTDVASSSVSDRKIKRNLTTGLREPEKSSTHLASTARYFPLPPAPYLPFLAQTFQQLAQRALLDPGGGRNVSDCHFLLSLPQLKTVPSAQCLYRFRRIGRRRTGKEQKTSENDERSKVGHFIPLG